MTPLSTAFEVQARACAGLGSPFMARLCALLADIWPRDGALATRAARFTGDLGPACVSLPLRVAGGLHALVLTGADDALTALYPPQDPAEAAFRDGIAAALARHDVFLADWIDSPPQTNEIRRSAVLIAGAHVAVARFALPVHLSELGASGGLNLIWDRIALQGPGWRRGPADAVVTLSPDWRGPPPPDAAPVVAESRGVDLNPIDPRDAGGLLRLSAYLWADQPERLARTRAAAAVFDAHVDRGDAVDWLEARLAQTPEGRLHLIQNTVAWQYFPPEAQARGQRLIEDAGARATEARPLAWLQMETDGDTGQGGAAVTLRLWPGDVRLALGRADFHGRWIDWRHG